MFVGMSRYLKTAWIAIIVICIALTGCSKEQSGASEEVSGGTEVVKQTPGSDKNGDKYDPPIELSTVMFNFNYPKFDEGDDLNNNRWSRHIEEQFGIKINTWWDVPSGQYQQKTNLMIASGKIPDFFAVTPTQFRQLYEADLIEDLTDVYRDYVTDKTKAVIEGAGPEVMASATLDGRLMAIPWSGLVKEQVPVIWIRKDWMEKLELSPPTTLDDVLAISEAFTTKDPDGNNKDDTFGLGMYKELGYLFTGFINAHHAYKGIWIEKDGKLAYSSIQPEMKTALEQMQKLYQAGQIDPEYGVKTNEKFREMIGENKIGMYFGGLGDPNGFLYKVTPDIEWLPFAVPSIDNEPAKLQHGLNIFNYYWVVKKGTQHPEALFKLTDMWLYYFYETMSQEEYEEYVAVDRLGYWMSAPMKIYRPIRADDTTAIIKVLNGELGVDQLAMRPKGTYEKIVKFMEGDMSQWSHRWQFGPDSSGAIAIQYDENNQYKPDQFITTPTPAMVKKKPTLEKLEDEMIHKIMQGASLDEFDAFVEKWKKLGGDEITEEVNEWYKGQ